LLRSRFRLASTSGRWTSKAFMIPLATAGFGLPFSSKAAPAAILTAGLNFLFFATKSSLR
jgi:hypothetical protein